MLSPSSSSGKFPNLIVRFLLVTVRVALEPRLGKQIMECVVLVWLTIQILPVGLEEMFDEFIFLVIRYTTPGWSDYHFTRSTCIDIVCGECID